MTKYEFLQILEPFDDEIVIRFWDSTVKERYPIESYYRLDSKGEGEILLSINKPDLKVVKLSV